MKIYFLSSLHGYDKLKNDYHLKIIEYLKGLGHSVNYKHLLVSMEKVFEMTDVEYKAYYKDMVKQIKNSDFVLAEISLPSVRIGYEIALSLENEIPVLVLNSDKGERTKYPLFIGNPNDKLILKGYNKKNIPEVMDKALEEISQLMDIRFNFFISPKMSRFLDWISKDKMIPKAVFLRKLIEPEMEKAKEFPG